MSENISVGELSALQAAIRLRIDLNRVYMLLRLGRVAGRKDEHGQWRVSASSVEARIKARQQAQAVGA